MNRILALTLLLSTGALALARSSVETVDTEQEIRTLEAKLNEAVVRAELDFFGRIFAEDFTHTNHNGAFRTKAQWLANHKPGAKSPYDSLDTEDLSVRIYGETAVVTGRSIPKGKDSKGKAISGQFRFTRIWTRRDGRWQVVAFQGTRITSS